MHILRYICVKLVEVIGIVQHPIPTTLLSFDSQLKCVREWVQCNIQKVRLKRIFPLCLLRPKEMRKKKEKKPLNPSNRAMKPLKWMGPGARRHRH
jgi:hypothetical protein